jgi:hypothetical protein
MFALAMALTAPACAQVAATPSSQASADAKSSPARPKVICKRVPVVGSNVGTERVCFGKGDSEKSSEVEQRQPDDQRAQKGTSGGN